MKIYLFAIFLVSAIACQSATGHATRPEGDNETDAISTDDNISTQTNMDNLNIDFSLQKGSSRQMFRASSNQIMEFNGGDLFNANVNISAEHKQQFSGTNPTVTVRMKKGATLLAEHQFVQDYTGSSLVALIMIPATTAFPSESWSAAYAHALSKMDKGKHDLILEVSMSAGSTTEVIGLGKMIYNNSAGNGNYAEQAKAIQEKLGKDESELYADFAADHGASNVDESKYSIFQEKKKVSVTVVNNCGLQTRPFRYGNSDWITLDGSGGKRTISVEVGTKIYRSDSGSPTEVTTISDNHEGATITLCL